MVMLGWGMGLGCGERRGGSAQGVLRCGSWLGGGRGAGVYVGLVGPRSVGEVCSARFVTSVSWLGVDCVL